MIDISISVPCDKNEAISELNEALNEINKIKREIEFDPTLSYMHKEYELNIGG